MVIPAGCLHLAVCSERVPARILDDGRKRVQQNYETELFGDLVHRVEHRREKKEDRTDEHRNHVPHVADEDPERGEEPGKPERQHGER